MADELGLDLTQWDPRVVKYLKEATGEGAPPPAPAAPSSPSPVAAPAPAPSAPPEPQVPAVPGDPTVAAAADLQPADVRGRQFQNPELGDEALKVAQQRDRWLTGLLGGGPSTQAIALNRWGIAAPLTDKQTVFGHEAEDLLKRRAAAGEEMQYGAVGREEAQKDLARRATISAYLAMQRSPEAHAAAVRQVAQADTLATNNGIPPTREQLAASEAKWGKAPTLVLSQALTQLETSAKNAAETAAKSAEGMKSRQAAVSQAQLTPYEAGVKESEALKNIATAARERMEASTGPVRTYWESVKTSAEARLKGQEAGIPEMPGIPERLGASAQSAAPRGLSSGAGGPAGVTAPSGGFDVAGEGKHQIPEATRIPGSPPLPEHEENILRHGQAARANLYDIETKERPNDLIRAMGLPEALKGAGVKLPYLGNVAIPATQLYKRLNNATEAELNQMTQFFTKVTPGRQGEAEAQAYTALLRPPAFNDLMDKQGREEYIKQRGLALRRFHEMVDRAGEGRYVSHIVNIQSPEQYSQLPSGTRYVLPDGRHGIKK